MLNCSVTVWPSVNKKQSFVHLIWTYLLIFILKPLSHFSKYGHQKSPAIHSKHIRVQRQDRCGGVNCTFAGYSSMIFTRSWHRSRRVLVVESALRLAWSNNTALSWAHFVNHRLKTLVWLERLSKRLGWKTNTIIKIKQKVSAVWTSNRQSQMKSWAVIKSSRLENENNH